MLYKVEGIVIRATDYGESHKIVTLFTRETGKVGVMARGAKKLKSRFGAMAQLFTYGEYTFYKSGQLGNLQYAEILDYHQKLREDLHMAAYSSYLAELTDRMLGDQERNVLLFEQLLAAFRGIMDGKDPPVIVHIYEMKILSLAGYLPQLEQCVCCGDDRLDESPTFSIELGGMLCPRCQAKDSKAVRIDGAVWKLLKLFQYADIRRLGQINVKDETKAQLKRCMRGFMDRHMDTAWKSRQFLDQMDKYQI